MPQSSISILELPGPGSLPRYRVERYIGKENAVSLSELPEADAATLRELYQLLKDTLETAATAIRDNAADWMLRRSKEERLVERIQSFARSFSIQDRADEDLRRRLRKVYHDARGGALNAAVGQAQLMELKGNEVELPEVYGVFNAVRDHLKILRNCFLDLDSERRERDLARNAHSAKLFRDKWEGYHDAGVRVHYVADFDGDISSSCLEFSSVERAMYNLVNNAMGHTADGEVTLFVRGLGGSDGAAPGADVHSQPSDVRIATANAIPEVELATLRERFGDALGELFMGGFTLGGSGVGLSICTELVANAYGLQRFRDAIDGGYVGAKIVNGEFVAWIHWPTLQ